MSTRALRGPSLRKIRGPDGRAMRAVAGCPYFLGVHSFSGSEDCGGEGEDYETSTQILSATHSRQAQVEVAGTIGCNTIWRLQRGEIYTTLAHLTPAGDPTCDTYGFRHIVYRATMAQPSASPEYQTLYLRGTKVSGAPNENRGPCSIRLLRCDFWDEMAENEFSDEVFWFPALIEAEAGGTYCEGQENYSVLPYPEKVIVGRVVGCGGQTLHISMEGAVHGYKVQDWPSGWIYPRFRVWALDLDGPAVAVVDYEFTDVPEFDPELACVTVGASATIELTLPGDAQDCMIAAWPSSGLQSGRWGARWLRVTGVA